MDELYEIFSLFSGTDWNLKCIVQVLRELENAVPRKSDMEKLIGVCVYYFNHIEEELEDCIQKLDIYILSMDEELFVPDQENKKMRNLNEYHALYQEILTLKPQDTLQLILDSDTEEEKEFFELIGNYLLQKGQERLLRD